MFDFLKKKEKSNVLHAPCKGRVVPITEVPDPTFAEKILGDGFAVIPEEGKIYAPADGEITMVFDTLHAISLTSTQGTEILLHIGLETVNLKGEPFTPHVKAGDQVKQGDLLMDVDLQKITAAGLNTITPVLICNTDDYKEIKLQKEGEVTLQDEVVRIF
ncbi:MAG TPA: PTS glucose transporter subunit IIA [Oribacterium sp.]|mgnify:FL=1|nr:PTS glucose transporter subunit IIA [Oribacterium sp.]HCS67916.1 PTS glucose transporter subunit IIA [Oribacterium sp.]